VGVEDRRRHAVGRRIPLPVDGYGGR